MSCPGFERIIDYLDGQLDPMLGCRGGSAYRCRMWPLRRRSRVVRAREICRRCR